MSPPGVNRPLNSPTETPSLKSKTVEINWAADIYKNVKIKSDVENTWILQENVALNNLGDFQIKCGNKVSLFFFSSSSSLGHERREFRSKRMIWQHGKLDEARVLHAVARARARAATP